MDNTINSGLDPVALFGQRLAASLTEGTFVRLALSPGRDLPDGPQRVLARCVTLKGEPHLSFTFKYAMRDEVENLAIPRAVEWLGDCLGQKFRNALLCTTRSDWQLSAQEGKKPKLIRHPPSSKAVPSRDHDQPRRNVLDKTAQDWLSGLGVMDARGKVRPGMADKFSQINRFLEIFSHLAKDAGWRGPDAAFEPGEDWTMVDMGAGKGYLTFGLWHLWRRVWGFRGKVVGVEARADLVEKGNSLAKAAGEEELEFVCGNIGSIELPTARVLIALHACDTATDDAIQRGIRIGSELILVAPCCHKELRSQLGRPGPLASVLRHGIMEERMAEWTTDGLRALFLEWAGYRTKIFEFVSSEHTAKNLMITAVRTTAPFKDPAARKRVEDLKEFFGIAQHALDPLLLEAAARG